MTEAPRKKRDNAEERLQIEVSKLLSAARLLHYHGANEGDMPVQYRVKLKRKGTFAGFPDVMVFEPFTGEWVYSQAMNICHGLAIELKVGRNKPTAAQEKWLWDLKGRGWRVEVCYTLDEVLAVLRECYPHKFPK